MKAFNVQHPNGARLARIEAETHAPAFTHWRRENGFLSW